MAPTTVTRLPLNQIATQQQDAIVFDVSSIASLGNEASFLIFYLSKEDEYNGYGTVIQLDPQTKQAAIYADLNPEYTYLFYTNEQGQLQTLLWCIEVSTQTRDGLFIAHAKSYGRGISPEDLQRFKQVDLSENQPQAQHGLAESYTPAAQPTPPSPSPLPSPAATAPSLPTDTSSANSVQTATSAVAQPPAANNQVSLESAPQPAVPAPGSSPHSQNAQQQPHASYSTPVAPPISSPTVSQKPLPDLPPSPDSTTTPSPTQAEPNPAQTTPPVQSAPNPATSRPTQPLSFTEESSSQPTTAMELNLPPLAAQPAAPSQAADSSAMAAPVADILQPIMPPAQSAVQTQTQPTPSNQARPAPPKQPVGRPPKPLLQDQLWPVSPEDFTWVKNMSRQPIAEFRDQIHQKAVQQIRTHKPGLMEDWQFTGLFEQAFAALCVTYELIPALRHDILKSLLNGRVVENIHKTQRNTPSSAATL